MADTLPRLHWRHRALAVLGRPVELAVLGTVLLIGAAIVVGRDADYAATSTVLFVDSPTVEQHSIATQEDVDPLAESPLARFHDPTVVSDVFSRLYLSRAKQAQLLADGMQGELVITPRRNVVSDPPDHGPVFEMTVIAATPAEAQAGSQLVLGDLLDELARKQQGYDPDLSVGVVLLAEPELGQPLGGSRMRSTVGFAALAALLALGVRHIRLWLISHVEMPPVSSGVR